MTLWNRIAESTFVPSLPERQIDIEQALKLPGEIEANDVLE